jgi:hypothetical protein
MQYIGPLIQTILWVGLIGAIVWRFHLPIHNLLVALADRVKSGSDLKAGPFALTANVQAQPASQQAARASQEIAEAYEAVALDPPAPAQNSAALPQPPPILASTPTAQFRANYFLAEDLAMRAVQAEYGAPISRQITAGQDQGFDGAFVKDGKLNVVEVKYSSGKHASKLAKSSIARIAQSMHRNNWTSARLVLAIVVNDPAVVETTRKDLESLSSNSSIPVDIRVYSMSGLKSEFGITDEG